MHIHKSTATPWRLLTVFAVAEIVIAFAFIGDFALRARGNLAFLPLEYVLLFLHRSCMASWIMVALWRANRAGAGRGVGIVGLYIAVITVKDLIGNTVAYLFDGEYIFAGCVLMALQDTLLNTLLIEGGMLLIGFAFVWLIFLWRREPSAPYGGLFQVKGNDLSCAIALFVGLITFRYFISRVISTIQFGQTYYWLLRTSEIWTIILDFAMLFLIAFVSYLLAGVTRRYFLSEEPEPAA